MLLLHAPKATALVTWQMAKHVGLTLIVHTPATVIRHQKSAPKYPTLEPAIPLKITHLGTPANKTWDV